MSRVYESIDLTEPQADAAIAASKNDIPPATDTQKISQPNGLFTVICTYDDPPGDQSQNSTAGPASGAAGSNAPAKSSTAAPKAPAPKPAAPAAPKPSTPGTSVPPTQAGARQATGQAPAEPALTLGMLQRHWPRAAVEILQGIAQAATNVFAAHHIDTPLRMAHFMAQISEESGAGTEMVENLNYSAQRMMVVWPRRFPTLASAQHYANNPSALGDKVYNGRMGNKPGTDDGFEFRGRGCLQLTGRANYQKIGDLCGLDLVSNPNQVVDPEHTLLVAAVEFENAGCLPWCDQDSIMEVSALINLGHLTSSSTSIIGFADRESWLATWKNEFRL